MFRLYRLRLLVSVRLFLCTHTYTVYYTTGKARAGAVKPYVQVSFTYFFFCCLVLCDSPP